MKKLLLTLCTIFTIVNCSFSQTNLDTNYLKKSRNQKTAAWILLGIGVGFEVAGLVKTSENAGKEVSSIFDRKAVDHSGEYLLYIAGTTAIASSVALFISARRNKKKALKTSLEIKTRQINHLKNKSLFAINYPVLTLKIRF